jgi:pimeloyl-ACP methyl ester carboxylesterase
LILVDPVAGPRPTSMPLKTRLRFTPVLGLYVYQTMDEPGMAAGQAGDFLEPNRFPDWATRYDQQVRFRGFGHALLSTRREQSRVDMDSVYQTVDKGGMPVLLLWGTKDQTVPFERNERVRKAIPRAEFHAIDGAAHLPILEQAARTDSLIIAFLGKQTP